MYGPGNKRETSSRTSLRNEKTLSFPAQKISTFGQYDPGLTGIYLLLHESSG